MKLADRVLQKLHLRRAPKMTVTAVLIKADGTRQDLGVIAEGHVEFTPDKE